MKILHSAVMLSYSPGIYNQMLFESLAAESTETSMDSVIFSPVDVYPQSQNLIVYGTVYPSDRPLRKLYNWMKLKKEYYTWLRTQQKFFDVLLIRYSVHDPLLLHFLMTSNIPILLVHHTLEVPELKSLGKIGKIRAIADNFIGNFCISFSSGVIGVTNEIIKYEKSRLICQAKSKKSIVYPNGIFIDEDNVFKDNDFVIKNKSDTPEILFVASYFFEWHGLDLLLQDLRNTESNFILHIIGVVNDSHKKIADNDHRVIFHGSLSKMEINTIANNCSIGLSSFALNRKGMSEACTLKVREYLSLGLPVYSGHYDTFPKDFIFFKVGEPTFNSILNYCKELEGVTRLEVFQRSIEFIDKRSLIIKLKKEILELFPIKD